MRVYRHTRTRAQHCANFARRGQAKVGLRSLFSRRQDVIYGQAKIPRAIRKFGRRRGTTRPARALTTIAPNFAIYRLDYRGCAELSVSAAAVVRAGVVYTLHRRACKLARSPSEVLSRA